MSFILNSWIKNKDNEKEIFEIFQYLNIDLVTEEIEEKQDKLVERLNEIGEDIIYNKIQNGEI